MRKINKTTQTPNARGYPLPNSCCNGKNINKYIFLTYKNIQINTHTN